MTVIYVRHGAIARGEYAELPVTRADINHASTSLLYFPVGEKFKKKGLRERLALISN
jgi:hypothetical protein